MRAIFHTAILFTITALVSSHAHAQAIQGKLELYNRGLGEMKKVEKEDRSALIYKAFASAVSIDQDELIQPLIDEFEIESRVVLDAAFENAEHLTNLDFLFRHLRTADLEIGGDLVANLACALGSKKEDLDRFLEQLDPLLKNAPPDDEHIETDNLHQRRIEELRYLYQLGIAQNQQELKSIENFTQGISNAILKDRAKAVWLLKTGNRSCSSEKLIESIKGINHVKLAERTLLELALQLNTGQLESAEGQMLVRFLIQFHAENRKLRFVETLIGPTYRFEFNPFEKPVRLSTESVTFKEIAELCQRSKLMDHDPNFVKEKASKEVIKLLASDKDDSNERDHNTKADDKPGLATLLEDIPREVKPKFIVEYALRFDSKRSGKPKTLPDEKEILIAFDQCKGDDPNIGQRIASCLNSFTPPSYASKRVLFKMMKMLPEVEQVVTKHEIKDFAGRYRVATEATRADLIEEALAILGRTKESSKLDYASRFAFEFALIGDKPAMNRLLDQIQKPADKAWALFHCAMAFPPQTKKAWYSRRSTGGVF